MVETSPSPCNISAKGHTRSEVPEKEISDCDIFLSKKMYSGFAIRCDKPYFVKPQ